MNFLLIYPEECTDQLHAEIVGERARMLVETHELVVGLSVAAVVRNGLRGKAKVESISNDRVSLSVNLTTPPPPRHPWHLIVGLPRPQTVKKILHLGAVLGVSSITFVKSEGVPKSYVQSKSLRPEEIEEEFRKAIEQSGDSRTPEISIHPKFHEWVVGDAPKLISSYQSSPLLVVADTMERFGNLPLGKVSGATPEQPVFVAIGPESGWTEGEIRAFLELGFKSITLGERVLRVETAAAILLGVLLKDASSGGA